MFSSFAEKGVKQAITRSLEVTARKATRLVLGCFCELETQEPRNIRLTVRLANPIAIKSGRILAQSFFLAKRLNHFRAGKTILC